MSYINLITNSIGKWESLGFLEGLYGEQKEKVGRAFDLLAEYLLYVENNISEKAVPILLPTLRRVLTEYPRCDFNNPRDFVNYVMDYVSYYMPYYEAKKRNGVNIDPEALCCYECTEQIKAILKAREDGNV